MECRGGANITGSHLFCRPNKGFIRVLGCWPMGLPMIMPFCKRCKNIYRKECNVEVAKYGSLVLESDVRC
jgi:hypothetical protein